MCRLPCVRSREPAAFDWPCGMACGLSYPACLYGSGWWRWDWLPCVSIVVLLFVANLRPEPGIECLSVSIAFGAVVVVCCAFSWCRLVEGHAAIFRPTTLSLSALYGERPFAMETRGNETFTVPEFVLHPPL